MDVEIEEIPYSRMCICGVAVAHALAKMNAQFILGSVALLLATAPPSLAYSGLADIVPDGDLALHVAKVVASLGTFANRVAGLGQVDFHLSPSQSSHLIALVTTRQASRHLPFCIP